jgi:hypothetical protein
VQRFQTLVETLEPKREIRNDKIKGSVKFHVLEVQTCQINISNEEQKVEDAQKQFDPVKKECE